MTSLTLDGDASGLSGIVVSDPLDNQYLLIILQLFGCTDETACNYDSTATEDDGSCTFAEENFDCDGNYLDLQPQFKLCITQLLQLLIFTLMVV